MAGAVDLSVPAELLGRAATSALLEQVRRARRSFHDFAGLCLQDDDGAALRQAAIHRVMHLHVEECWRAGLHPAVLAPFSHGKTVNLVVGRVAYEVGLDPTLRAKVVCNNDARAMERTMGISQVLRSPAYRLTFPGIRPVTKERAERRGKQQKWTQHEIYVERPGQAIDPTVHAASIFAGGTGGRADLIVFDDVVDQENAINKPELREKVIANFEHVWMQRLEPHGKALYVGTPWHEGDLTHDLRKRDGWSVLRIWVSDDFTRLDMEVYNPPPHYSLPRREQRIS